MDNSQLTWRTEPRKVADLIPLEQNPFGKITDRNKRRLEEKIKRLGVFEIPTIDMNNELLTFNKRWHILMSLGYGNELIDVRLPNRLLSEMERKEVIISSNIHEGEWDKQILSDLFDDMDLDSLGLDIQLDELIDSDNSYEEEDPEYPVVQEFSEKYDALLIISTNEIDTNYINEILNMDTEKCYKSSRVGKTRIISASKFIELWKSK